MHLKTNALIITFFTIYYANETKLFISENFNEEDGKTNQYTKKSTVNENYINQMKSILYI